MKLAISREWFERKAKLEGDLEVAAGMLARDPSPEEAATQSSSETDMETRFAYGLNHQRRAPWLEHSNIFACSRTWSFSLWVRRPLSTRTPSS